MSCHVIDVGFIAGCVMKHNVCANIILQTMTITFSHYEHRVATSNSLDYVWDFIMITEPVEVFLMKLYFCLSCVESDVIMGIPVELP